MSLSLDDFCVFVIFNLFYECLQKKKVLAKKESEQLAKKESACKKRKCLQKKKVLAKKESACKKRKCLQKSIKISVKI
jgi:hypothetical protein